VTSARRVGKVVKVVYACRGPIAEHALEQFEENRSLAAIDLSDEEFEGRREPMREAIREAKRVEEAAKRTWHRAIERAEREIRR